MPSAFVKRLDGETDIISGFYPEIPGSIPGWATEVTKAALLGMFGRCADDAARIGVNSVDDVGRACMTSTDDIGSLMSGSGDDLFRQIDHFHVPNYVDDLRFETAFHTFED